jgi:hypothetical protein
LISGAPPTWPTAGEAGLSQIGLRLLSLVALLTAPAAVSAETKRIFTIPPTQWDQTMSRDRPASIQGPTDLAYLTGGIVFGLSPAEVSAKLSSPVPDSEWADLPFANEYPDDVRYFWIRLGAEAALRAGISACTGANSYVVFLFRQRGLFRVSWRLLSDNDCPMPRAAAQELYARYLALDRAAALATHYETGKADAVEITDPGAFYLVPYRWSNRQR